MGDNLAACLVPMDDLPEFPTDLEDAFLKDMDQLLPFGRSAASVLNRLLLSVGSSKLVNGGLCDAPFMSAGFNRECKGF